MTIIKFQTLFDGLLLKLFLTPLMLNLATSTNLPDFPVAKPGCVDGCGNISIPFPFGTTKSCYKSINYWVTCNETTPGGPKLFWWNTTIEVLEISLEGQMRLLQTIAKNCYRQNGSLISGNTPWIRLATSFTVNITANRFTIVGCDNYGFISGKREGRANDYLTGCTATCGSLDDLSDGSCGGLGCCQVTSIPTDVSEVNLTVKSYNNQTEVWDFNKCSYAFLVEEKAFTFSQDNLTNLENVDMLPMVADWAIGYHETCDNASSTYACESQDSTCYMPDNGYGYRCRCKLGYRGNPYLETGNLTTGCQDIDECQIPGLTNCTYKCENTPGSFKCYCPKGYLVNGTTNEGCSCPQGYRQDGIRPGGCIRNKSEVYKPITGTALGLTVVVLVICLIYLELKRRRVKKMKHMYFLQNGGILLQEKLISTKSTSSTGMSRDLSSNHRMTKIFSSNELEYATNNFHNSMIVGQGGFGIVYKGLLEDKKVVAIKKAKEVDPNETEQFVNEVLLLSQISHKNVVKLLGCCMDTEAPLLVYEFINNGTLSDHLHDPVKKRFLNWNLRLKIATETAGVLWYLHSTAASTPIIHRDVKSDNILLDTNFIAKVSDFGASRLVPVDQTCLLTVVQGTFGYLDPEYMQTSQLTEKSDVYSFGVVLAELMTGMRALNSDRPEKERILANFFLSRLMERRLFEILDDAISCEQGKREQLLGVAKVAQACLEVKGEDRPSMREVAKELESLCSGGKQPRFGSKQDTLTEEMDSFHGAQSDMIFSSNDGDCSITGYYSFRDHTRLGGGR